MPTRTTLKIGADDGPTVDFSNINRLSTYACFKCGTEHILNVQFTYWSTSRCRCGQVMGLYRVYMPEQLLAHVDKRY